MVPHRTGVAAGLLAVALVLAAPAAALAQGAEERQPDASAILGEFTVSLPESALPADLSGNAGEWRIRFGEDGTHVVHHDDFEVLTGTHEIRGDRLIHRDEWGPYACAGPGTYAWHLADGQIHFTAVEDACAPRVAVLTSRPWSPAEPSTERGGGS